MKTLHILSLFLFSFYTVLGQTRGAAAIGTDAEVKNYKNTYALVIGISDYQEISDLVYADKDARIFAQYLASDNGEMVPTEHILLLLNEKATTSNIIASFEWIKNKAKAGDRVFIYFSGHGDVETLTSKQNGYLLTHNTPNRVYMAGGLPVNIVQDYITTLNHNKCDVVFIADACKSGKLAGGLAGANQTSSVLNQQWGNEVKILSCQPGELSVESTAWGGGRGVFSYYLTKGLEGAADEDQNGIVTVRELRIYLDNTVYNAVKPHQQNPIVTGDLKTILAFNSKRPKKTETSITSVVKLENTPISSEKPMNESVGELQQFDQLLANGIAWDPSGKSAWHEFYKIDKSSVGKQQFNLAKQKLTSALVDQAQEIINSYVKGADHSKENLQSIYQLAAKKLEKAIELLEEANPLRTSWQAQQLFLLGRSAFFSKNPKDWEDAIAYLNKSIELVPEASYSYNALGLLYSKLGNDELELSSYKKALEYAPQWSYPLCNIASAYARKNDLEKAYRYYENALQADSSLPNGLAGMAQVRFKQGEVEQARSLVDKALAIDSTSLFALTVSAYIYFEEDALTPALQEFKKALLIDPKHTNAINGLGYVLMEEGQTELAIKSWNRALELDPSYVSNHHNIGRAYLKTKNYQTALQEFNKHLKLDPNGPKVPYTYYFMACTYAGLMDMTNASLCLDKAFESGLADTKTLLNNPELEDVIRTPDFQLVKNKYPELFKSK